MSKNNKNIIKYDLLNIKDNDSFPTKDIIKNKNIIKRLLNKCYNHKYFLLIILLFIFYNILSRINNEIILNNHNLIKKINKNQNKLNYYNNLKVGICTPIKRENKYIIEFIEYYEKYGIDKIFLYDNNDIDDESFDKIIANYIEKGLVKVINWRGIKKIRFLMRNECFLKNNDNFDWLIFYDVDEFIYLKNYSNIKHFLSEPRFKNCIKINLNWVIHTDNNLIYYDNRTLHQRFPEIEPNARNNKKKSIARYKSILRGHIPSLELFSGHIKGCDGFGNKSKLIDNLYMKNCDFENYYIDHFYFKSVEEFVEKLNKGDNYFEDKISFKIHRIKRFLKINKITLEKINYIENKTNISLSKFKKIKI